jgi:3D (Asp-Asp-Asp) domain-containing protein
MAQRSWYAMALLLLCGQAAGMAALSPHPAAARSVAAAPVLAGTGEAAVLGEDRGTTDGSADAPAQARLAQANPELEAAAGPVPLQLLAPLQKVGELIQVNAAVRGIPRWRTWRATFYCDRGLTASGKWAGPGMIASGPEFRFGTIVDLPGWGPLSVEDRGGVIYNGRIDIWVDSCSEALVMGVQYLGGWFVSEV